MAIGYLGNDCSRTQPPQRDMLAWEDCPLAYPEDVYARPRPRPPVLMPAPHQLRGMLQARKTRRLPVVAQKQSNCISCGQTSVAMTLSYLTGKDWTDTDVDAKYGFELKRALDTETRHLGLEWKDKDFSKKSWPLIEEKLKLGRPVVMGMNGPDFSPSGNGHIITLVAVEGDRVYFLDPATKKRRCLRKKNFEDAPPFNHETNFYFCPKKVR